MRRATLSGLALAAVVYTAIPLVLPSDRDWLALRFRLMGLGLVLLTFVAYAWLDRRKEVFRRDGRGFRLGPIDVGLLLALPLYVLFVGNSLWLTSGDNIPTMALGPLLLKKQTIDLSSVPNHRKRPLHYSATRVGDRILPVYPLGTALR